jgi:ABC-type Fe3+-siderophore transport system permease subunit
MIFMRWLTMLALGLWMGGIITLGAVGASSTFKFLREHGQETLAPQLFGVMLSRFAVVSLVLGALALISWILDGALSRPIARGKILWMVQGACVVVMIGIALYLRQAALPVLLRDQMEVIAESLKTGVPLAASGIEGKSAMRLQYDALHRSYTLLTQIIFYLGAGALLCFAARLSERQK